MHVNAKQKPSWKRFLSAIPEYACIAVMVVVVIVASILAPRFFSTLNLMNILKQSSVMCILAIGMGFVLISGCMDLSVGVNMAVCALVAMVSQKYVGTLGGIGLALLSGVLISLMNFLIIYITRARAVEIMMITFGLKMVTAAWRRPSPGTSPTGKRPASFSRRSAKGLPLAVSPISSSSCL